MTAVIIAGLSLLFVLLSTILTLIWRNGSQTGEILTTLHRAVRDIEDVCKQLDEHIKWHLENRR